MQKKFYEKIEKADLRTIQISELPKVMPDFKNSFESKDTLIQKWLTNWIDSSFKSKRINENDLLPKKTALAYYLGVSVGTIQNAIRFVEDNGYLQSKQRIGTMIRNFLSPKSEIRKLTSKRQKLIVEFKKYIVDNDLTIGSHIGSTKSLAKLMNASVNTTRLALEFLEMNGILKSKFVKGNETNWNIISIPELEIEDKKVQNLISSTTLVSQVENDLREYINANLKVGDKLPSHNELSLILKVSIKTIHDAMKALVTKKIIKSRRGRYGTIVLSIDDNDSLQPKPEFSIFAKAEEAAFYSYQKIENYLKSMIKNKYDLGDKIPPMDFLAKELDVSTNTIKKALHNLSRQGYVQFSRGRYGGTFVVDIPEIEEAQTFRWLAVNSKYVENYKI